MTRALCVLFLLGSPLYAAKHLETKVSPGYVEFQWTEDGRLLKSKMIRKEAVYSVDFQRVSMGQSHNGKIKVVLRHDEGIEVRYEQVCLEEFFDLDEAMKSHRALQQLVAANVPAAVSTDVKNP